MEDRVQDVAGSDKSAKKQNKNRALAEELSLPILEDLSFVNYKKSWHGLLSYSFVSKHLALPIDEDETLLHVVINDPIDLEPLEEIGALFNKEVKPYFAKADEIRSLIQRIYKKDKEHTSNLIKTFQGGEKETLETEVFDLLDDSSDQPPLIKLLNLIIFEAIEQGASDIHFEPIDQRLRVRYRIDGVLQERHSPPSEYQAQVLTRIKVMAKLDIAERRLPQDGRIKLKMGNREIDFRVSTLPVAGGERIVLRILDRGTLALGLNTLAMPDKVDSSFRKLIRLPEGILLITGPTGSGKTTTLYSAIIDMVSDEINIMTIEDPVEYNLRGIAQIGVQPKINLTFGAGLRHILRQDPDVIMVGEIRDQETAEIAVQAALTGHLVMSTLHTNDAPSAITRLVDMGIEPYLISSSVVGILAQRLVRKICPFCKEAIKPEPQELKSIGLTKTDTVYRGKGCKECFGLGYRGRLGLYELLVMGNEIQKQIVKSPDASVLRQIAIQQGMKSLLDCGAQHVRQGVTTISEVLRVSRGIDEVEV